MRDYSGHRDHLLRNCEHRAALYNFFFRMLFLLRKIREMSGLYVASFSRQESFYTDHSLEKASGKIVSHKIKQFTSPPLQAHPKPISETSRIFQAEFETVIKSWSCSTEKSLSVPSASFSMEYPSKANIPTKLFLDSVHLVPMASNLIQFYPSADTFVFSDQPPAASPDCLPHLVSGLKPQSGFPVFNQPVSLLRNSAENDHQTIISEDRPEISQESAVSQKWQWWLSEKRLGFYENFYFHPLTDYHFGKNPSFFLLFDDQRTRIVMDSLKNLEPIFGEISLQPKDLLEKSCLSILISASAPPSFRALSIGDWVEMPPMPERKKTPIIEELSNVL